ncbi:MAG: hypothetical protein B7X48_03445 [Acidiphilium sp. 34-60-192]|nr:MAG: hypothetical protein B7X48_03445 [Acidiphilium sp. 34-60-192]
MEALVSRETLDRLRLFEAELRRWTLRINLIARADIDHVWARHILDSLQLLPLVPGEIVDGIDLGAGAGFPGMILALARPSLKMTLTARIETLSLARASLVTARALAPLGQLLELAAPLLKPEGFCLFPKGRQAEIELTAASGQWHMAIGRVASCTDPDAVIFRLDGIRRVT